MKSIFITLLVCFAFTATAQDLDPVKWSFEKGTNEAGEEVLQFSASIEKNWYLYSQHLEDGGPIPTSFVFDNQELTEGIEVTEQGDVIEQFDSMFEMEILKFKEMVIFELPTTAIQLPVSGYVEFMTCDDTKCLPPNRVEFTFD